MMSAGGRRGGMWPPQRRYGFPSSFPPPLYGPVLHYPSNRSAGAPQQQPRGALLQLLPLQHDTVESSAFLCPQCSLPMAERCRASPCFHVICVDCSGKILDSGGCPLCPVCSENLAGLETLPPFSALFVCSTEGCGRGFLDARSLQLHHFRFHALPAQRREGRDAAEGLAAAAARAATVAEEEEEQRKAVAQAAATAAAATVPQPRVASVQETAAAAAGAPTATTTQAAPSAVAEDVQLQPAVAPALPMAPAAIPAARAPSPAQKNHGDLQVAPAMRAHLPETNLTSRAETPLVAAPTAAASKPPVAALAPPPVPAPPAQPTAAPTRPSAAVRPEDDDDDDLDDLL
eukprot:GHVT01043356.1.p1 GENE.GHVT01043356.1~~GHVT01043356.1.p1  ORF type:complete len:346 (-),score=91.45 GHVT01043356.1:592-1629(-)